ncbi:hypothetical protein H0O03_04845 [Candidatus Micrarchaeota archaeon]|nr:hypothetical protein [Candidatus Micrarchaeota archaeon]
MTLKLERFDKKILQLLENGELTLTELQARFKIAPLDFDRRLNSLAREKYVHLTKDEFPKIQLGIKGFNALEQRAKRQAKKPKEKPVVQERQEPLVPIEPISLAPQTVSQEKTLSEEETHLIETQPFEIPDTAGPSPGQKPPKEYNPLIHGPLKLLTEVPATQQPASQPPQQNEQKSVAQALSDEKLPKAAQKLNLRWEKENEVCELCKADFKLSLNPQENNPIYGHCFCGAAYHQDCYESLAQNGGRCARCGRAVELKLDQRSQSALKQIKNLFD